MFLFQLLKTLRDTFLSNFYEIRHLTLSIHIVYCNLVFDQKQTLPEIYADLNSFLAEIWTNLLFLDTFDYELTRTA